MMSYWFYKMAAIAWQIYFRFLVWTRYTFRKVWSYRHTKFRKDILIHGRDITTLPVSENKRLPYWNSTSGFDFDLSTDIGMSFSVSVPNFIGIGSSAAELWRHSNLHDGGRQPYWIWFRVMVANSRSASGGLCFILKFPLDRIYSFGDRAILIFWPLGLKLPIHAHF